MLIRKSLPILTLILALISSSSALAGAKTPPTIDTPTYSGVTSTEATLGGTVTSTGSGSITEVGVQWGTTPSVYTGTEIGSYPGLGTPFTVTINTLSPNTTYYFIAYAISSETGKNRGETSEVSFTTSASGSPATVGSPSFASVTHNTAVLGGTVSDDGGCTVTDRGTVWGTSSSPTGNEASHGSSGTGSFSHLRSGLPSATLVYFRAWADNCAGRAWSADGSFTTDPAPVAPTVDTPTFSNVTDSTATLGGTVSDNGGAAVTDRGTVWGTSSNPTGNALSQGSGTGSFSHLRTSLPPGTLIYFRAYATNSAGISYSANASFTTDPPPTPPVVEAPTFASVTTDSAILGGTVTGDGGGVITDRGTVWGTSPSPAGNALSEGSGLGAFTHLRNGMPPGTLIYFRAYATNSTGTSYSNDGSFTTGVDLPVVTASPASSITSSSAVLGGEVTSDGGGTVTDRGTVWGTSPGPVGNALSEGSGAGTFSHLRSGLPAGVTVYFRTYATNSAGTVYSADRTFVPSEPPIVSSPTATNITYFSAVLGGTLDSDGGNPILSRGTVWNTTGTPVVENALAQGGTTTGSFAHTRFLPAGATIYYRAYATSQIGTGYSAEASFVTPTEPTVQASNISFPRVSAASFRVTWTPGNGEGSIVVVRLQGTARTDPLDGNDYTGNPDINIAPELPTNSENFVAYKGSGSSVLVTGLELNTTYTVAIYDYAGTGSGVDYLLGPAESSQLTTSLPVHNMDYGIDCGNCHNHGSFMAHDAEQEDVCETCHNPAGSASGKVEFALHLTPNSNLALDYVDCGFCHELHNPGGSNTTMGYNPITDETKPNKSFFRANVEKYVPAARPGAGFLHNDVYDPANSVNAQTPERAMEGGNDTTARGTCQVCHSMTKYHRSSNTAGSDQCHDGEQNNSCGGEETHCARCHQHNNRFIGVGGTQTCIECHSSPQGSRPSITAEFSRLSHHVAGTLDETDCEVCHDQGSHTGGKISLWDTDDHSAPAFQQLTAYTPITDTGEGERLTGNCLSCHDSDGASAEAAPLSPFNGSSAPPVIDATTWNNSAHNRDSTTFPSSSVSCVGNGVNGCHGSGHGSEKLALIAPADTGPLEPADYCFACHDSDGPSQFDTKSLFPADPGYRVTSMSGVPVNQRHDISTADQGYSGGVVSCANCHDVHADSSSNPVVDPDTGSALPDYNPNSSYTDDGYNFSYNAGGNLDPSYPEGCADAGCTPGYTEPDYIQYCLSCHDGTAPPGVIIPGGMVNMADAWLDDQHGVAEGTSGSRTGKGGLKAPYVTASDDAADNDASQPYAAMNCSDCHGSHGSKNIFNLKSEITIAGVQLQVGGTTTLNEAHYAGNTSYEFPLIGGEQVDHYWGAWCTFCHKVDAHPGKVELDACTGGHMHGGGSH